MICLGVTSFRVNVSTLILTSWPNRITRRGTATALAPACPGCPAVDAVGVRAAAEHGAFEYGVECRTQSLDKSFFGEDFLLSLFFLRIQDMQDAFVKNKN